MPNKNVWLIVLLLVIVLAGGWLFWSRGQEQPESNNQQLNEQNNLENPDSENVDTNDNQQNGGRAEVKTFTVKGTSDFKFNVSEMKVKQGDTVRVTFINEGGFHDSRNRK